MIIRIDTARNRLTATAELLVDAVAELEDLHCLAYERPTAAREAKVRGGETDHALDTHGDPKARAAYKALSENAIRAAEQVSVAAHDALALLRAGGNRGRRGPKTIQVIEHAELLAAQGRRIARGDYVPVRALPQPDGAAALNKAFEERDGALATLELLRRVLEANDIEDPTA